MVIGVAKASTRCCVVGGITAASSARAAPAGHVVIASAVARAHPRQWRTRRWILISGLSFAPGHSAISPEDLNGLARLPVQCIDDGRLPGWLPRPLDPSQTTRESQMVSKATFVRKMSSNQRGSSICRLLSGPSHVTLANIPVGEDLARATTNYLCLFRPGSLAAFRLFGSVWQRELEHACPGPRWICCWRRLGREPINFGEGWGHRTERCGRSRKRRLHGAGRGGFLRRRFE